MIIVDLDGTIADCSHRLKHIQGDIKDWDTFFKECINDTPIENILNIVKEFIIGDNKICVFLTGRSDIARKETVEWLKKHIPAISENIDYHLIMRPQGDHSPDHELKPKLLKEFEEKFAHLEVEFILEDRSSVVKKWRELGYTCFQVADGDF